MNKPQNEMELRLLLGQQIVAWRRERWLTQEELAKMVGYTRDLITHLEAGERGSKTSVSLRCVCNVIGIDFDAWFSEPSWRTKDATRMWRAHPLEVNRLLRAMKGWGWKDIQCLATMVEQGELDAVLGRKPKGP